MKVNVPEKWEEIKLHQFQSYTTETRKEINKATMLIQTISTLCNIPFDTAVKMRIKDVQKISKHLYDLLDKVPQNFALQFKFNDKNYGFIPKLDDITIGEYADLEFYLSDKNTIWDNMHWIMSILYREVENEKDGKYTIKEYKPSKKRAESFKELPMDIVYAASNFFLTLGQELVGTMPNYLNQEEMKKVEELMRETGGGGSE